jgi:hypothetical protein
LSFFVSAVEIKGMQQSVKPGQSYLCKQLVVENKSFSSNPSSKTMFIPCDFTAQKINRDDFLSAIQEGLPLDKKKIVSIWAVYPLEWVAMTNRFKRSDSNTFSLEEVQEMNAVRVVVSAQ